MRSEVRRKMRANHVADGDAQQEDHTTMTAMRRSVKRMTSICQTGQSPDVVFTTNIGMSGLHAENEGGNVLFVTWKWIKHRWFLDRISTLPKQIDDKVHRVERASSLT
mmetsp:Transcript_123485/g.174046  ORF Transcript_123485/g.174046 Transcript_123485/m.174046 type:complete len:108 (+) Transcript_123485:100-423(+)